MGRDSGQSTDYGYHVLTLVDCVSGFRVAAEKFLSIFPSSAMISLTMSSFFVGRGVVVGVGWLLRSMNATQRFLIQQQAVSATCRI